jgi:hypothetical protein
MRVRATWCLVAALLAGTGVTENGVAAEGGSDASDEAAGQTADLSAVRARAQMMPIDTRIDVDKRIGATVERVNRQALERGSSAMAARLSAEFSVPKEALLEEKGTLGWSWGEVMIAHTLLANTPKGMAFQDLETLRSDGLSWAAIAYGLRFRMEDFEDAIKAQGRVAMGLTKADGKSEVIGK